MHLQKKLHGGLRCDMRGWQLKSCFAFTQEIASALIAGVIVVVVDWKNSASAAPQNQLQFAECSCRKRCMWVAMCYAGLVAKSLLKVRLRCKACHVEERAAFRLTPLRKINCTLQNALAEKAAWWAAM